MSCVFFVLVCFFSSRKRIQHGFILSLLSFGMDAMPFEVAGASVP